MENIKEDEENIKFLDLDILNQEIMDIKSCSMKIDVPEKRILSEE